MIFLLALIPATALTVAGYIVLYVAGRSEGGLQRFGKYLSFWAFTLAALVVVGGLLAAAHGPRCAGPYGMDGMHGHYGMHGPMRRPMDGGWHRGDAGPEPLEPNGSAPPAAPGGALPAPSPSAPAAPR